MSLGSEDFRQLQKVAIESKKTNKLLKKILKELFEVNNNLVAGFEIIEVELPVKRRRIVHRHKRFVVKRR